MSDLLKLTNGLQYTLRSNDWTCTHQLETMAEQYAQCCEAYNEISERCRLLCEKKMLLEAINLANSQEPPLAEQLKILAFPESDEFRKLCMIYNWSVPAELNTRIIKELYSKDIDVESMQTLVNAYRQIARTDDSKAKVLLLRHLVQMDPRNAAWKTTLAQMEQKLMDELILKAKDAIINGAYKDLQSVQQQLLSEEWSIKAPAPVLNKISSVLEEHRKEELKKQASSCLEKINEAYSNYEFEKLETSLEMWKDLVVRDGYVPEENQKTQVREAEEYFLTKRKERSDQQNYERIIEEIKSLLEKESSFEKVEVLCRQITLMNRELPEYIERQFTAVREYQEMLRKRKRLLKAASVVLGIALTCGLMLFLAYHIIMHLNEKQWVHEITLALEETSAEPALELLETLKKQAPHIYLRPAVATLEKTVLKKAEQEKYTKRRFKNLAALITGMLKDYERNRQVLPLRLSEIKRFALNNEDKNAFAELRQAYESRKELFEVQKKESFEKLVHLLNRKRTLFYSRLEENDVNGAEKLLRDMRDISAQAGAVYLLISEIIPGREKDFAVQNSLYELLNVRKGKLERSSDLMERIRNPQSLKGLHDSILAYHRVLPDNDRNRNLKTLLASSQFALELSETLEKRFLKNNQFSSDIRKARKIIEKNKEAAGVVRERFKKMRDQFSKSPLYGLAAYDHKNQVMVDLYFTKDELEHVSWRLGSNPKCWMRCLQNESGDIRKVEIEGPEFGKDLTVLVNGELLSCELLYPEKWGTEQVFQHLAPHVKMIYHLHNNVLNSNRDDYEVVLIRAIREILKDRRINAFLRLSYAKYLSKILLGLDPKNPSYVSLDRGLNAVFIPKDFNWLDSFHTNRSVQQKISKALAALYADRLYSRNAFFLYVHKILMERKLTAVGYLTKRGNSFKLHRFANTPAAGELWYIDRNENNLLVIGDYQNTSVSKLSGTGTADVFYKVLFAPVNPVRTSEISLKVQEEAAKYNLGISDYPKAWPIIP